MKKIALVMALVAFVGTTTVSIAAVSGVKIEKREGEDDKKKKCKKKKSCCAKKTSCSKKEGAMKSCHGKTTPATTTEEAK